MGKSLHSFPLKNAFGPTLSERAGNGKEKEGQGQGRWKWKWAVIWKGGMLSGREHRERRRAQGIEH